MVKCGQLPGHPTQIWFKYIFFQVLVEIWTHLTPVEGFGPFPRDFNLSFFIIQNLFLKTPEIHHISHPSRWMFDFPK